jgi:uncharacterized coiled-coil protein SlyX
LKDCGGELAFIHPVDLFVAATAPFGFLALEPVTFRYKKTLIQKADHSSDSWMKAWRGLIPTSSFATQRATLTPFATKAMLLNEFLKEHSTVQELKSTVAKQNATIAQQQKGIEAVTARLEQQAAQIQKVSAQLEASKPALHVVNNP